MRVAIPVLLLELCGLARVDAMAAACVHRTACRRHRLNAATLTAEDTEALVDVRSAGAKGLGAFAAEFIPAGRWVGEYEGTLTTPEATAARYSQSSAPADYLFGLSEELAIDAQNSTHFTHYLNHAQDPNLEARVDAPNRRVSFFAVRDISVGEEMCFDYGPSYWLRREGAPEADLRNFSDPIYHSFPPSLSLLYPPPVGSILPLTPLTVEELLAALALPEEASRAALLRCLEYFGSRRIEPRSNTERADELWELRCGVSAGARVEELPRAAMSHGLLQEAAAACVVQAIVDVADATGEASNAFTERLERMSDELGLIRRWRARLPPPASARHEAVSTAAYLAWKNPGGNGVRAEAPISREECEEICALLQGDAAQGDGAPERAHGGAHDGAHDGIDGAIEACLARLEKVVPPAHLRALVSSLEIWFALGEGCTVASVERPTLAPVAPAPVPRHLEREWSQARRLVEADMLSYDACGRGTFFGRKPI